MDYKSQLPSDACVRTHGHVRIIQHYAQIRVKDYNGTVWTSLQVYQLYFGSTIL